MGKKKRPITLAWRVSWLPAAKCIEDFLVSKYETEANVMAQAFRPNVWGLKQKDCHEFEANLRYVMNSRSTWAVE